MFTKAKSENNVTCNSPPQNQKQLFPSHSLPALLSVKKSHPLLNQDTPPSANELSLAAEALENIVADGSLIQSSKKSKNLANEGRELSDRVLSIVYGTMKCIYQNLHFLKT
jgi:hypothetical protein